MKNAVKKRRRVLLYWILALVLSLCGVLTGCSHEDVNEKEDRTTIAVSTIGPTHGWATAVLHYAENKLKEVAESHGWDYICVEGNDSYEQSQQVIDLVEQQVDCLILLPMDGASLKTAAVTVQNADIPLIIFDREIPEFAPTATVKGDNRGIGVETARYFNNYFPKGTTVLELMGDTSTVPFLRTDGFDNTINSNFRKIQVGYTEWQRDIARKLFADWVKQQDKETLASVGAIYTHDDEIALGVLDELDMYEEEGTLDEMFPNLEVIAGSSNSQEMYQRIKEEDRYVLFSMTYLPQMIEKAIKIGESVLCKENYEEMLVIPTTKVDKSNVDQYLDTSLTEN
ncbi:MAG: substrate-binding domain-containing protein [Lachnospiraceae bacterium]|nr:substrate-binding domain-containing protein [Lachnospiraceae bacterium]